MLQDLHYAFRQLRRSSGFAFAAVLTLALGIGANTAIFSVVNGLLLRPPGGIQDFDALVAIYTSDFSGPPYSSSSVPDVQDFAAGARALSGVAAYTFAPVVLSDESRATEAELVMGNAVTANFFDVLGTTMAMGRPFASNEGGPGGRSDVVVLGNSFWQSRLGGDPGIVGKQVRLGGTPFTVIGIAAENFEGLLPGISPAFYAPIGASGGASFVNAEERGERGVLVVGRLANGATIEQARTQLQSVATALAEQYPDNWLDVRNEGRRVTVIPASQATIPPQLRGSVAGFVGLLMAVVGGVLLIGCVNIANLLLARATGRQREIGVRMAIGAGRGRLIRQLLTESMVLAGIGAAAGITIAWLLTRALTTIELPLPVDVRLDVAPDARVLGFAAAVTVAAGMLFGLAPALMATRLSLISAMHREAARGSRRLGLRAVFAAAQITVAMVLLVAGGLLVRSLLEAQSIDPGFRAENLLFVSLALDENARTAEQRLLFQRRLRERVASLPGAAAVSYAGSLPLGVGRSRRSFSIEGYRPGENEDMELHSTYAGPDYFQTMGTRLLRGREFAETDDMSAPAVAIVNEAFVQRYLPGQDPLGKRLGRGGDQPLDIEIIGLAEDGKYVTLAEEPLPFVWLGADRRPPAFMTLVVRGAAHPGALTQPIRQAVAEVDPDAAITTVAFANQHLAFALLPQRVGALLLSLFGLLGLSLAALGIYGVMAYAVTQRTREFGIRLALGARAADITRMVVRQGMTVAAMGGAVGLVLAAVATRLMRFLLFDVAPLDPATFAGVTLIVAAAAFVANWLPARRSARVEALLALRSD